MAKSPMGCPRQPDKPRQVSHPDAAGITSSIKLQVLVRRTQWRYRASAMKHADDISAPAGLAGRGALASATTSTL
jgi:hypothetical protein